MYSEKYQEIQLLHGKERLLSPLGCAEENTPAGRTRLRWGKRVDSEQLCLEAVPVELLDLYWFDNQYCHYCQYINYLLFNA